MAAPGAESELRSAARDLRPLPPEIVDALLHDQRGALYLAGRLSGQCMADLGVDVPDGAVVALAGHIDPWLRNVITGATLDDGYEAFCRALANQILEDNPPGVSRYGDDIEEGDRLVDLRDGFYLVLPGSLHRGVMRSNGVAPHG